MADLHEGKRRKRSEFEWTGFTGLTGWKGSLGLWELVINAKPVRAPDGPRAQAAGHAGWKNRKI